MRSCAQLFPAAQISVWCGEQTLIFMTHLHETSVAGLNLRCHVFARRPRSPLSDGRGECSVSNNLQISCSAGWDRG